MNKDVSEDSPIWSFINQTSVGYSKDPRLRTWCLRMTYWAKICQLGPLYTRT